MTRRSRQAIIYRLQAVARRCPDFPEAAIWAKDLDAVEADAEQRLLDRLRRRFARLGSGPGADAVYAATLTDLGTVLSIINEESHDRS
jgi:hypothetical protein